MIQYKLKGISHFNAFKTVLLQVILAAILLFLMLYLNVLDIDLTKTIGGISALIIAFPASYLHYCYYLENKDFLVEARNGTLDVYDLEHNLIMTLTRENVKFIEIYASATHVKVGVPGPLPHEGYHYAIIRTNEKDIILTSLLYPDILHLPFKFMEARCSYHKTLFAAI